MVIRLAAIVAACISVAPAQTAARGNRPFGPVGERVICVVPMQGGTAANDPRRPLFVPNFRDPAQRPDPRLPGTIQGFRYLPSDDGRFAIVEFWAFNRAALRPILNSGRADVVAHERASALRNRAAVEAQFRVFRRDFSLDSFLRPTQPAVPGRPGVVQ
jgi:hypothetical protein